MEPKNKTKRVSNAKLKIQVEELVEELRETQKHVMSVQETLIRLVKEWDKQMMQLRGATQELTYRVTTITDSISDTVEVAGVAEE